MKSLIEILGKHKRKVVKIEEKSISPMSAKQMKRDMILKAAKKYFTYEQYMLFRNFYTSQRVLDNRKVYHVAEMLYNKYRKENNEWQLRKERTREKFQQIRSK
jgi:hypothetical protein